LFLRLWSSKGFLEIHLAHSQLFRSFKTNIKWRDIVVNPIAYGQFHHYKKKIIIFKKPFCFSIMNFFFHPFEFRIFLTFVTCWMYIIKLPT
jgi:hypothetical protein